MHSLDYLRCSIEKASKDRAEESLPKAILDQEVIWQQNMNIPIRFKDVTFSGFKKELQPVAYERAMEFANKIESTDLLAIVLCSESYGTGKTHLLVSLMKQISNNIPKAKISACVFYDRVLDKEQNKWIDIKRRDYYIVKISPKVKYITEPDLMSGIRATYDRDSQDTELDYFAGLNRYELLVIDDVGKVKPRDLSFVQQVYYRIVEYRYVNLKHIALASNLTGDNLEQFIGGAAASRLSEMTKGKYFVTMKGQDYRLKNIIKEKNQPVS